MKAVLVEAPLVGAPQVGPAAIGAPSEGRSPELERSFDDLARLAGMLAGTSAWIRDASGECVGHAGPLEIPQVDLASGPPDEHALIADATADRRLANHPAVLGPPYIRSWARFPFFGKGGEVLGSLEVADTMARFFPDDRLDALAVVARQAGTMASLAAERDEAWREAIIGLPIAVFLLRLAAEPALAPGADAPSAPGGDAEPLTDEGRWCLVGANVAACRLSREPISRLLGKSLDYFPWARPHNVGERCMRVARTGVSEDLDLTLSVGNGSRPEHAVRIFRLPGGHLGVTVEDMTERRGLPRLKAEFMASVSHELRTPLSAIRGAVGLLEGGVVGRLPDSALRLIGIARDGTERLGRLVNDILDLERLRGGLMPMRHEPMSVSELVDLATNAVQSAARAAGVRLERVGDAEGDVRGDRERLAQALTNLLSNAVKFSPSGGVVQVGVTTSSTGGVRFAVTDEGRGLAEEEVHRLFLPFQSVDGSDPRTRGGAGLGLAISRFIVEGHGGMVGVDTTPGVGSTFWIELPRYVGG
ncbi:MAG: GAF domain-containing sensor histidine kinase [Pseudomonadota bacterium]|nr:GAF domain-containing sensor histidine kinase [Pseudomonadota bacterium]